MGLSFWRYMGARPHLQVAIQHRRSWRQRAGSHGDGKALQQGPQVCTNSACKFGRFCYCYNCMRPRLQRGIHQSRLHGAVAALLRAPDAGPDRPLRIMLTSRVYRSL